MSEKKEVNKEVNKEAITDKPSEAHEAEVPEAEKVKYEPEPAPAVPMKPELRTPGIKVTTKQNLIDSVKSRVKLEVMKPVLSRLRTRLKEIKKMSQAESVKIMKGNEAVWITESPEMFISNLIARISDGVGKISYYRYEMNGLKKKLHETWTTKVNKYTGEKYQDLVDAKYMYECLVVETIKYGSAIEVEEIQQ